MGMDPRRRLCDFWIQAGAEENTIVFSIGPKGMQQEIFIMTPADLHEMNRLFIKLMEDHGPYNKQE